MKKGKTNSGCSYDFSIDKACILKKKNAKTIQNRVKKIDLNSTIFQPSSEAQSPTSTDCPWVSEDEYSCMLLIIL